MNAQELLDFKNWVVTGDVLNPEKYAHRILNSLQQEGFNAEGVSPSGDNEKVYNSLKKVPYKIEVLDLCINPIKGIKIVKEALELNIDKILIQPGAESEEILEFCSSNNITAIEGCALVELSYRNRRIKH